MPACLPEVSSINMNVSSFTAQGDVHVVTKVVKSLSLVRLVRGTDVSDLFTQ